MQVIISIQGTIMGVRKPYFLEPGYDAEARLKFRRILRIKH